RLTLPSHRRRSTPADFTHPRRTTPVSHRQRTGLSAPTPSHGWRTETGWTPMINLNTLAAGAEHRPAHHHRAGSQSLVRVATSSGDTGTPPLAAPLHVSPTAVRPATTWRCRARRGRRRGRAHSR